MMSKISIETLRLCRALVAAKQTVAKMRLRHRPCPQYRQELQAVDAQLAELNAELAAQELGEEEYPPSREASAITALQALREAVRSAQHALNELAYQALVAWGREPDAEKMGVRNAALDAYDLAAKLLSEETAPHMGEGDS